MSEQINPIVDENHIMAERKIKALKEAGIASRMTSSARILVAIYTPATTTKPKKSLNLECAGRCGRSHDAEARDGQSQLRHDSRCLGQLSCISMIKASVPMCTLRSNIGI